jgi:hypothetical protein
MYKKAFFRLEMQQKQIIVIACKIISLDLNE